MRLRELLATLGDFPGMIELLNEKRNKCLKFSSLDYDGAERWDKWLRNNDELNDAEVLGIEPYHLQGESYTTLRVILREAEELDGAYNGIPNRVAAFADDIRRAAEEAEQMHEHTMWMLYYWSGNGESDSADEAREQRDAINYWSDANRIFRQCKEILKDMAEELKKQGERKQ